MPDSNDLNEVLFRASVRADALRATGLRGLEGVTRARQAGLEREHGRLAAKLGPEHPRTRALAARMENGAARLRDLKVEVARAETVAPQAGAAEWILHGYVRFKNLEPAPDLTVALIDGRGQWVQALGFACTDARGHFQIVASVGKVETEAEAGAAGVAAPAPERQVHIRITDRDRLQLYRGEDAIVVSPGSMEYREIVLGDGTAGCVSPEEETTGPEPKKPRKKDSTRPPAGRRRKR
ncbi:MAG: hypothetical protein ACREMX_13765 [Gemmatimonadales bacterium]